MSFNKKLFGGAFALFSLLLPAFVSRAQQFQLSVSAAPNPVNVGNTLTYTIYVTNQFALPSLANVYITNRFSTNVVFTGQSSTIGQTAFTNGNDLIFPVAVFGSGVNNFGQFSFTLIPSVMGALTNQITVVALGDPVTAKTTNFTTQVTAPTTDLAIGLTNSASGAFAGGTTTIGLTVTNLGTVTATGVVVTNTLPASFGLLSVTPTNASTTFANGVLIWTIGSLTNGEATQLLASVRPTNSGTFSLTATVSASTADTITTNNAVTNSILVDAVTSTNLSVTISSPQQFNPQTGLMEEVVTVRNNDTVSVDAVRLFVSGLGTNRLYNAAGTNNGVPYVQHNAPLAAGASVNLLLEYFVRTRTALTNLTRTAVGVTFTSTSVTNTSAPNIMAVQLTAGGFLIEFQSIPGRSYTILYADNSSFTNALAAQPAVVAPADRVQWIDNGPPKTISPPANVSSRYYRVILNP